MTTRDFFCALCATPCGRLLHPQFVPSDVCPCGRAELGVLEAWGGVFGRGLRQQRWRVGMIETVAIPVTNDQVLPERAQMGAV